MVIFNNYVNTYSLENGCPIWNVLTIQVAQFTNLFSYTSLNLKKLLFIFQPQFGKLHCTSR